jgi:HemY protein
MLKTFFFLVKMGLVIGALIWLSEQKGSVHIEWMDYTIDVHVGLFLAGLLVFVLVSIFAYRVLRTFVDFPASYRYYSHVRAKEMGYKALTLGLTAVAAGDTRAALKQAEKARSLLPEDQGLPLLLEAQAARLDGREGDAQVSFAGLLENKDTSFLGVRGLLQASMDAGDMEGALELSRQALKLHPKQPWILRTVYDLEISQRIWNDAEKTLKRAVKAGAITKERGVSDQVAIALAVAKQAEDEGLDEVALSEYRRAQRLDGKAAHAVLLAVEYYIGCGQVNKAKALIEKAWKKTPHAAMVDVWERLMPEKPKSDALERLKWFEKLVKMNSSIARANVAAGIAACDAALWGEARSYFEAAEKIRPSKELYKAFSVLENKVSGDEEAVRGWLEKAADVSPERVWICRESGRIYDAWSPIALPQGSFNTIEWNFPLGEAAEDGETVLLTAASPQDLDDTLIEAPKVA